MFSFVTTAAAAESGGAQMPQFDVTTFSSQVFWLALAVITLFVVLRWFALPRIEESITNRQQAITSDQRRAEELNRRADEIIQQHKSKEAELHRLTSEIVKTSETKTVQGIEQAEQKAQAAIDEAAKAGEERIRTIRDSALVEIAAVAREVTEALVENILPGTDHRAASHSAVERHLKQVSSVTQ